MIPSLDLAGLAASATRRSAPFLVGKSNWVSTVSKADKDLEVWIEHGRPLDPTATPGDYPAQLPWGTEAKPSDSDYNTAGGGTAIFFEIPGGSTLAQLCVKNVGVAAVTAGRADAESE